MKPKSAKNKGRNFEIFCLEMLKQIDGKAYRVFGSGAGLQKGDIYCPNLEWLVEAKNHKTPHLGEWIKQLERQANDANKSVLLFKKPKSADINPEIYAIVSLTDLMAIASPEGKFQATQPKNRQIDRELEYNVSNLSIMCKKVLKSLNRDE